MFELFLIIYNYFVRLSDQDRKTIKALFEGKPKALRKYLDWVESKSEEWFFERLEDIRWDHEGQLEGMNFSYRKLLEAYLSSTLKKSIFIKNLSSALSTVNHKYYFKVHKRMSLLNYRLRYTRPSPGTYICVRDLILSDLKKRCEKILKESEDGKTT